jgi:hypothetical protein
LAEAARVSSPTIKRLEAQDGLLGGRIQTAAKIRSALETAGVEFTNGDQPGVRLTKAAAAHAGASKPTAVAKAARTRTAKATGKKP